MKASLMVVGAFLLVLGYVLLQINPYMSSTGQYLDSLTQINLLYSGIVAMLIGAPVLAYGVGSGSPNS